MDLALKTDFKKLEKELLKWGDLIPRKEVSELFGYSRPDNFARFLKNPKYNYGVVYYDISDSPHRITLRLFFDLVKKRIGWDEQWEQLFSNLWTAHYESKLLQFTPSNRRSEYKFGNYTFKAAGKFYTYSITTRNIADSNDLCPYEVYRFAVKNWLSYNDPYRCQVDYHSKEPEVSFNDRNHVHRYGVMGLLVKMKKEYPMDELQRKRFFIYMKALEKMLMMQFEVDSKRQEREKRQREKLDKVLFGCAVTEEELTELKKIYRSAAFMCHPDVTGQDGAAFRSLNEAYNKKDLRKVRSILNKLRKES